LVGKEEKERDGEKNRKHFQTRATEIKKSFKIPKVPARRAGEGEGEAGVSVRSGAEGMNKKGTSYASETSGKGALTVF